MLTTSQPANNPLSQIKSQLDQMRPQLMAGLPSHISPDRFQRTIMTAVNNNPDLISADRRSLFNACIRAATDGLLPDGREGALVIFKDKTGKKLVQFMPMVFGLIKKIRQSGEIDSIGARIVYQKEIDDGRFKFVIEDGKEKLYHDPMLWGDRGTKVLVYAYARFKDGGYVEYAPLHRVDVEKRKAASKGSSFGPWVQWEDEMWLKTAIRAIAKRLPLSADLMSQIEREPEATHFDELRHAAIAQLGATPPVGELAPPAEEPVPEVVEEDYAVSIAAAQALTDRACAAMIEQTSKEALDEHVQHMRVRIADEPIPDDDKQTMIRQLNTAYYERAKTYASKR